MKKINRLHWTYALVILSFLSLGAGYASRSGLLEDFSILSVTNTFPEILLLDTDAGDSNWEIEAAGDRFQIGPEGLSLEQFRIYQGSNANSLVIDSNGNVVINGVLAEADNELEVRGNLGSTDNFAQIAVSPKGSAGDSAVFAVNSITDSFGLGARVGGTNIEGIFRSSLEAPGASLSISEFGHVGIGVSHENVVPFADLHIKDDDGSSSIFMDPFGDQDWEIYSNSSGLWLSSYQNGLFKDPFKIGNNAPSNSFVIQEETGQVGIGTLAPTAPLHVRKTDGSASLVVEEAGLTSAPRQMMELINNGAARFSIENTDFGSRWDFSNGQNGHFLFSYVGTSGAEMRVTPTGNLFITGALTESSDRDKKENFEKVDCGDVLNKVSELDITTWNYKSDEDEVRHMGPMAQDFHKAFSLGHDDKTIAGLDKNGIALASIKALNEQAKAKDKKIAELESELEDFHSRVERLETLLEQLAPQN